MTTDNPFFTPSELPYQLPDFERIDAAHYRPAFEQGMADQRAEIRAITANPEPPTFENTIVALERSGQLLERVSLAFFNQTAADADETVQEIEAEISPKLSAHHDAIMLDPDLFARIKAVHDAGEELDPESQRLLERTHLEFTRAGAGLEPGQQARLKEINEELSSLSTTFQQKLMADTNESAVVVDDVEQLDGLSGDAIAAAAQTARERGHDGAYVITLNLPTAQPALHSLTSRELRERIHTASISRGNKGDEHDTTGIVARMARLRAERAALLGYSSHACYALEDSTAGSPAAVYELLSELIPAAIANAHAEAAELQKALDADTPTGKSVELRAWDWSFYSERVRRSTYDVDEAELRPYFELERVLHDGVFHAAHRLYGIDIVERTDLVGYHPDVRVFEVFDADGTPLGLFLGDFYTRASKRGGAWMDLLVKQSSLMGTKPVVVNNLNITKVPDGEPTLLAFHEVKTLFHEFGHALHGLFSEVRYPTFSAPEVRRDFVEFPSQVNEMWATWPDVLANYARHHQTGEPLPQETVQRIVDSQIWDQGFKTTEYLAASLLDLAWHEISPDTEIGDVLTFEAAALERAGVALEAIPPRYRTSYFAHIFAGGYSAGYYSYIWSEVLDADTVEWFRENGGLTRENGDHFRRTLLARGGSTEEMAAYREFRGRDPRIEPLLQRRGLDRT
ncbi:M3 family metallopeptidase [Phytoactinopolyspora halophila]|uniref:M3 family metallopeptidase n=1 Tax=Phytoactinopolyspora halophila TaxID=1981511 RepID=UPI001B8B907F|nr:M3 family metallopeptidase [Phytoactinopolyspora halophila]